MHVQARAYLLQALDITDDALHERRSNIGLIHRQHLALSPPVLPVLECPLLFSIMEMLMVSVLTCNIFHGWSKFTCHERDATLAHYMHALS